MNRLLVFTLTLITLSLMLAPSAVAQESSVRSLDVRLVSADNSGKESSRSLADVLPILQNSLRYKSYQLVSRRGINLSAGASANLAYGYQVQLSAVDGSNITVRVSRQGARLLQTRLALRPGRPLLLGGFAHGSDAKLIIIITLR